jgi:hypothetical protein
MGRLKKKKKHHSFNEWVAYNKEKRHPFDEWVA